MLVGTSRDRTEGLAEEPRGMRVGRGNHVGNAKALGGGGYVHDSKTWQVAGKRPRCLAKRSDHA